MGTNPRAIPPQGHAPSYASPTLEMMERIAAGLGVTVRDMVDFDAIVRNAGSEGEESSEGPAIAAEYSG
ncbi:MAG: hypothetical protein IKF78_03410 [Atopobiaceae bacterium]|nr:hypothetical protein [Atopobiaceae bacterium]